MIIKCKMCGGDIQFNPGETYGTCEYCGSTSTIPKADDEGKLNRYNRANHFRRQGEFDKAVTAYEKILEQDETDAEAHWGAVISRFGIEYVEDPAIGKRIPTCHRVQLSSILADEDYKAAVQYAPDAESRRLYEEEATRIAEIQKGILAISQNEKPYDVFICYKETDESGQRTRDSQWAQEVYYGLTEQGYKVFFSRITLEDKLGQEYEPYIFAALQSAKVMVVIGSKPEYFSAVWVKNEWSRYLALMANDRKRLLIPCYRGMDPYDLPDELSSLQSQDMSKIGFMQDLLRGIRKVLEAEKKPEQPRVIQQVVQTAASDVAAPGVSSLMQRAYLFLEDGDYNSAAEYLDRVLDIDPKYAPAYAAKVCVTFGIRKEDDLAETTFQYEDNPDWQKALRFADAQQKNVYVDYAAKVKERVNRQIRDYAYDCAMEMAVVPGAERGKLDAELDAYKRSCTRSTGKRADGSRRADCRMKEDAFNRAVKTNEPGDVSESGLKTAAAMFTAIGDNEAAERTNQCKALAEQARQKAIYLSAVKMRSGSRLNPSGLEEAARKFLTVPDYKDAKAQAQACADLAESIRSEMYDTAVKAMNAAGSESRTWAAAKEKLALNELNGYRDVARLREKADRRYKECLAAEQEAKRQEEERRRREAEAAAAKKKRHKIIGVLSVVAVITTVLIVTLLIIPENNYRNAVALQQAGKYEEAVAIFKGIKGYKDVDSLLENDQNLAAVIAREAKIALYKNVGSYVFFGTYPHTTDGTDIQPIEWLVLDYDAANNRALLISRYGLDSKPYNTERVDITWEKCTLRTWLNNEFLNAAFTVQEQKGIVLTAVDNSKSQGVSRWDTNGGNNTQDKVFLLSDAEANKYFGVTVEDGNNKKSRVNPTAYALQAGAFTSDEYTVDGAVTGAWWLRSPGSRMNYVALVDVNGALRNASDITRNSTCVRPALWLDLTADVF